MFYNSILQINGSQPWVIISNIHNHLYWLEFLGDSVQDYLGYLRLGTTTIDNPIQNYRYVQWDLLSLYIH